MDTTASTSKAAKVKPFHLFDNCGTKTPTAAKTKSGKCAKSSKSPTAETTAQTISGGDFGVVETILTLGDTVDQLEPVRQQIIFNYYFLSALYFLLHVSHIECPCSFQQTPDTSQSTAAGPVTFVLASAPEDDNAGGAGGSGASTGGGDAAAAADASFVENNTTEASTSETWGGDKDTCVVESETAALDGNTVGLEIKYYATMEGNTTGVLSELDYQVASFVAAKMFGCGTETERRVLLSSTPLRKGGRALEGGGGGCVGVISDPTEEATGDCGDAITVGVGESCSAVEGGVTLVLSDPTNQDAAVERAMLSINDAFKINAFTREDSHYYVPKLLALTMGNSGDDNEVAAATTGINSSMTRNEAAAPISAAGAAVLSVGLIAFIALALLAFRHKRKRGSVYDEFDDFEDDLAAKDTSSTDGSLDDILRDLDNAYGNQVDVHHCNSAMCPICNGKQTTFIDAGDNDTVSEMYPDQFEIGDNQRNRSFEYMAKPGASSPRFDNPANIRPRLYEVEDTVEL